MGGRKEERWGGEGENRADLKWRSRRRKRKPMDSASLYGVSCESNEDRDEMIFNLDFGMLEFSSEKNLFGGIYRSL